MSKLEPSNHIIEKLISLFNQKNFLEIIKFSNKILNDYPDSILVNNIAGVAQTELKNFDLAKNLFIKAINLNSKFTDAHYNLANIYNRLNEPEKAITSYKKVIEIDKNYFKAYNNLGNIFRKKNLYKIALEYYILSLKINPNYKRAYYNLAGVLQHFTLNEKNVYINKIFLYLLEQKIIVRPNAIANNVINGLFLNSDIKNKFSLVGDKLFPKNLNYIIEQLSNNELLLQFMKVCPIPNYYFENNLKKLRKEILNNISNNIFNENYLKFIISLSSQCYLNEYIYSETKDETNKIKKLSQKIKNKVDNNKFVDEMEIICLSCYVPLYNFRWLEKIKPSKNLFEIFNLQFYNFIQEKEISSTINTISKITNNVSIKVKNQYEENPYPRWTNLGLSIEAREIKDVINDIKLNIDLKKIKFSKNPEILIAGCGTGQHVITTASKYKNVKIYALDLSFSSLSYAKRKAMELDIKNINFIQGDLLNLNLLNKKFDLIESVGVLHHMADPLEGWKVLRKYLKNDGLMLIGLYSKKARENISQIRKKIKKLKISPKKNNIVNFRNNIFENINKDWDSIKLSPDFYSTSGVRDLLFHVQEHRFTISQLDKYMKNIDLVFLGFEDTFVTEKFKEVYNKSEDIYNLLKWEEYEINNPRIFAGMYQFWCKKKL